MGTLGEEKIAAITEESFRAMTSNGDVKLDIHIYKLSFLNFLLGKQPNGPGQFMFGTVTWEVDTTWLEVAPPVTTLEEASPPTPSPPPTHIGNGHVATPPPSQTNQGHEEVHEQSDSPDKPTHCSEDKASAGVVTSDKHAAANGSSKRKSRDPRRARHHSPGPGSGRGSIVDVIDKNGGRRKSIIV